MSRLGVMDLNVVVGLALLLLVGLGFDLIKPNEELVSWLELNSLSK